MGEPNKTKTIRVRIAVCVADDGRWSSCGSQDGHLPRSDDDIAGSAVVCMPESSTVHFIEADIPLPQTIEAKVHPHNDRGSIADFAMREAARFDREAVNLNKDAKSRVQVAASTLRTFSAQIQRGDDTEAL